MQLKDNVVKDLLLLIESQTADKCLVYRDLYQQLTMTKGHSLPDIKYTIKKLLEVDYIIADLKKIEVYDITHKGHIFLRTIKEDSKCSTVRTIFKSISLTIITDIILSFFKSKLPFK